MYAKPSAGLRHLWKTVSLCVVVASRDYFSFLYKPFPLDVHVMIVFFYVYIYSLHTLFAVVVETIFERMVSYGMYELILNAREIMEWRGVIRCEVEEFCCGTFFGRMCTRRQARLFTCSKFIRT